MIGRSVIKYIHIISIVQSVTLTLLALTVLRYVLSYNGMYCTVLFFFQDQPSCQALMTGLASDRASNTRLL